ncbi:acyl-CoA synthetase [Amycolatopsis endophytica]|uniref:Fatty-acyl-CoA synthase n=1 Tax=Amycolatopsis endophytica TaxID=860233 RepID=A0A853BCD9_9PSEU|nr:acyl-CoA synthetase [Amycolatopsis endophytica]NYI92337.1 fatty-acyl-CoA synthase [Amycolatopsis endophytica]
MTLSRQSSPLWPSYEGPDDLTAVEAVPLAERGLPVSTYELLVRTESLSPERPALTVLASAEQWESPQHWTYAELAATVRRYANAFTDHGIRRGDPVAVLSPNTATLPAVLLGAEAAGIVSPLNPALDEGVLESLLRLSRAKILVAAGPELDPEVWHRALALASRLELTAVFALRPTAAQGEPPALADAGNTTVRYLDEVAARQPSGTLLAAPPAGTDIAAYFHTGGTTGAPKLAAHTHTNQVVMAWSLAAHGMPEDDLTIFAALPLFHVNALQVTMLAPVFRGRHVVWAGPLGYRDPQLYGVFWRIVERYRVASLSAVPMVYAVLAQVPVDADISTLRFGAVGAAPLPEATRTAFETNVGVPLIEGYGLTEATCASTRNHPGAPRHGSVGQRLPYQRIKAVEIDQETGAVRDLPTGTTGVLAISGPTVFAGYVRPDGGLDDGGKVVDGWLDTGDRGYVTADGYVYLRGREKDLIIRGGHNIDPRGIEDALLAHPAVRDAAAVGRPDRRSGEVPIAFVTLSHEVSVDELREWAAARAPEAAAAPKEIIVLDELPMTSVGKQYKPALRLEALRRVVADELAALDLPETGVEVVAEQGTPTVRVPRPAAAATARALADALGHYEFSWSFTDTRY